MDEEMMKQGNWMGSVLCVSFSILTVLVAWQEWHLAYNKKASIRWQDSARRQFQAGLKGDLGL